MTTTYIIVGYAPTGDLPGEPRITGRQAARLVWQPIEMAWIPEPMDTTKVTYEDREAAEDDLAIARDRGEDEEVRSVDIETIQCDA